MLHQYCNGYMATFQLYWWRKTSGAPLCIISGMSRHLSRTTDVPSASWIASLHEKSEITGGIRTYSGEGLLLSKIEFKYQSNKPYYWYFAVYISMHAFNEIYYLSAVILNIFLIKIKLNCFFCVISFFTVCFKMFVLL